MMQIVDMDQSLPDDAFLAREEVVRLLGARTHDPFAVLGHHEERRLLWLPLALRAHVGPQRIAARPIGKTGIFTCPDAGLPAHPDIEWEDAGGQPQRCVDPWNFEPQIGALDLHLFAEGRHWHIYRHLGASPHEIDGIAGTLFATWAPNAERVSVVGDFNDWDGRCHPLRVRGSSGVWELFLPGITAGALYKFEVRARDGSIAVKTDPYGRRFEQRPATAAVVTGTSAYDWGDSAWLAARRTRDWQRAPLSVYEAHLGSWQRRPDGGFLDYRELASRIADHALSLGFTHIELMPITEHPLDESWGYQATGYFAPTSRFGSPDDFRFFVDHCHRRGLGVLLDWVPAHFPRDTHALARFDGAALYEHADPQRGEHRDWGTLIYDYGRHEVRNFLLASANFWLEEFHVDGLRVDAVASMLYLDYSREPGDWSPNAHGGRENLEAVNFLRELNALTHGAHPGTITLAEESTSWPLVTRPVDQGGLGFSMKWSMGWMHDTLRYLGRDPVHRHFHHQELSFGMLYAFSENFQLPLSHDEVVHGKRSLVAKMPGDSWQRHANLRLLYAWQFTYPGTKLLFMGGEFAQEREWSHARSLDWERLEDPLARGVLALLGDLNALYRGTPALHANDFEPEGFRWIDCHDAEHAVLSYLRIAGVQCLVVVLNFTPVVRRDYRLGLPFAGEWLEVLNTDSRHYGGTDVGNGGRVLATAIPHLGEPCSISLTLPPLGAVVLAPARD